MINDFFLKFVEIWPSKIRPKYIQNRPICGPRCQTCLPTPMKTWMKSKMRI